MSVKARQAAIEPGHRRLSIRRQCSLMSLSRSTYYYEPQGENPRNLQLMRRMDEQFLETPYYGSRQMVYHLRRQGYRVGRKRVRRLMAKMGLAAIYPKPRTSKPNVGHQVSAPASRIRISPFWMYVRAGNVRAE